MEKKKEYWPLELKSRVKYFGLSVDHDDVTTELSIEFGYPTAFFMLNQLKILLAKEDYHLINRNDITPKYCRRHFKCSVEKFNEMIDILISLDFVDEWLFNSANCIFSIEFSKSLYESYRKNHFRTWKFPKDYFPDLLIFTALENKIIAANRSESPLKLDYNKLNEIRLNYHLEPKGSISGNIDNTNSANTSNVSMARLEVGHETEKEKQEREKRELAEFVKSRT